MDGWFGMTYRWRSPECDQLRRHAAELRLNAAEHAAQRAQQARQREQLREALGLDGRRSAM